MASPIWNDVLRAGLADSKANRDRARSALDRMKNRGPVTRIDPTKIERFGSPMRESITTGSVPFRKACSRSLIDAVAVDDRVVRIHGSRTTLEQAVIASCQPVRWVRGFYANGAPKGNRTPVS